MHRACQVFYQLKGGTVQFGEAHSRKHGHASTGATHAGAHTQWSSAAPVHLIGGR
jgi:triacylglycerol lipase